MTTLLKLGPKDHGRPIALEEFLNATGQEGYRYEIINGRVYVSPVPNAPEGRVERWVDRKLQNYADGHPEVINYVHPKARVFVPGRPEATAPEPDVAAYHDFPLDRPFREIRWQDVSPLLVVEVVSEGDPSKDLVRNVELYLEVPSIREYWIVDGREDPEAPTLYVHRRRGRRWQCRLTFEYGETYATKLLPGFALTIDPRG